MANIKKNKKKNILILAGNLNFGRSYLITTGQFLHFLHVRIKDCIFSSNAANYLNEEESL